MPQTDMSAEVTCRKIASLMRSGNGSAALAMLAQRDRETLIQAAERVRNAYSRQFPHFVGFDGGTCIMSISIDHAIELILATLAEGGKHERDIT